MSNDDMAPVGCFLVASYFWVTTLQTRYPKNEWTSKFTHEMDLLLETMTTCDIVLIWNNVKRDESMAEQ